MNININEPIFKAPDNIPIGEIKLPDSGDPKQGSPIKKRKGPEELNEMDKEDECSSEDEDETKSAENLAIGLNEICSNPVILMGVFDAFFDSVPNDVKIQYKNVGIAISTYYLKGPSKTHKNLTKYITNKLK